MECWCYCQWSEGKEMQEHIHDKIVTWRTGSPRWFDQSTQFIVNVQTLIYASLPSSWERGPSSSAQQIVQDTMKLLLLIGNAIISIYSYPSLKAFHIALWVTWQVTSLLFHFRWLGDVKQTSVSDSSGLPLKAKIHASSKSMKDKTIAEAHKFNGDCPGNRWTCTT